MRLRRVMIIIVVLDFLIGNFSFAYIDITKSIEKGILTIDYKVKKSEENAFLSIIREKYEKDDTEYEYVKIDKKEDETNEKQVEHIIELNNISTNNENDIKNMVDGIYMYEDEDGYTGELTVSNIEVQKIIKRNL